MPRSSSPADSKWVFNPATTKAAILRIREQGERVYLAEVLNPIRCADQIVKVEVGNAVLDAHRVHAGDLQFGFVHEAGGDIARE